MTQEQLARLLNNLSSGLKPVQSGQEKLLQKAQEMMAASVIRGDIPYSGEALPLASARFSKATASEGFRKQIDSIAAKTLAADKEPETRFFIRTTPVRQFEVAGSIPDWAVGAKPSDTLGPFLNEEGREIWIDFYRIEKLVTLYMQGAPAFLFKTTVRGRPILVGGSTPPLALDYQLNAGSIWINAKLLAPSAPAGYYVGLKIKSGQLKTSMLPVLQNNQATLNPAAQITVTLETAIPETGSSDGDGNFGVDANKASFKMPSAFSFVYKNGKVDITSMGAAGCTIFGQSLQFSNPPQAAVNLDYNASISKVLVPWAVDQNQFSIQKSESPFVSLSGEAPIAQAWWGLPAAQLDTANPVQAESGGSVVLQLGSGLRARWNGLLHEDVRLQAPLLNGEPGTLSLLDLQSKAQGALQELELWKEKEKSAATARLSFLNAAPFMLAISGEQKRELLTSFCDADVQADRPLKVDASPFPVRSRSSALLLAANAEKTVFYLLDDNLLWDNKKPEDKDPQFKWQSIALENALFTVTPVSGFMLFGELNVNGNKVLRANTYFLFGLHGYLPTLPDPYVGNLSRWRKMFSGIRQPAGAAMAQTRGIHTMLVCLVQHAPSEEDDRVETNFYFGMPPENGLLENEEEQEEPAPPAPAPDPNPRPGRTTTPGRTILNPLPGRVILNPTILTRRPVIVNPALKTVQLKAGAKFAQLKTSVKLTMAELVKERVTVHPLAEIFQPKVPTVPKPETEFELQTATVGNALNGARLDLQKNNAYEDFWDKHVNGNRLEADVFSLLDVSSNAHQMGISLNGQMMIVETKKVSTTHEGQASVSNINSSFPFVVEGMHVKSSAAWVKTFTLPQIAWEPLINLTPPDREHPSSPKLPMDPEAGPLYFANDGGATRLWNNSEELVALAPIPVINALLEDFKTNPKNFTVASFTLPFGLKAIGFISRNFKEPVKPDIENLRPLFRRNPEGAYQLEGGIQLKLKAGDFGKHFPDAADNDSIMFPGYTIQLNNLLTPFGTPSSASTLGHRVTEIFNNEFLVTPLGKPGLEASRGVPLTRMDLTGYGASIFSKWISPSAAMAQTSQSRFDVMLGRTGHEVIQVKSILYPWGIRVVRTITVFRTSSGYVYRTDSGWKAESDGLFDFSYRYLKLGKDRLDPDLKPSDYKEINEPFEFHPGIIKGLFNIRNIKDAPSVAEYTSSNVYNKNDVYVYGVQGVEVEHTETEPFVEPVKCGAVYFDADVEIENVVQGHINKRVVSKKILGYVQVAPAGKPLTPQQLQELMNLHGGVIGGDIDCVVDINKSDQQMKLTRFDANVSVNAANQPAFVLAGRGQILLPKDGSWSMVQHDTNTGNVTPLPNGSSVPLIRKGRWIKGSVINPVVVQNELLRVAHPIEIIREAAANTINFGYLQITDTQKALFLTPAYGLAKKMLLSKTPPIFADAYRLMTGSGIFPNIGNAVSDFGKTVPLFHGKNGNNLFEAFTTNPNLKDGVTNVLELMEVQAVKAGEAVIEQGMSLLQKNANGLLDKAMQFDVPDFDIPLVDTEALRIYIEYKTSKKATDANYVNSKLQFDVESFANDLGDQWKSRMNNLAMVVDLGEMKRLMTIKGNFDAKKGKETGYEGGPDDGLSGFPTPEIEFSPALQPVIDILEILATLSAGNYAETMKKGLQIAMSNSGEIWEYKFEASKEIPLVRFPPTDEAYNSAQTPLKLEASLGLGVYFNAALKITTDPGQLLPTAGAFLAFHGGLKVMCVSVGAASIYAIGNVDVKIACDTKIGPSLALDFGFGVEIVVSLPVVGNASVSYLVAIQMYADKDKVIVAALMRFRGNASLLAGLVSVTITIEAKGLIVRENGRTDCSAQVTFALDISIFLIIDISFSKTWGEDRQIA